jgi:phosphomannomutase
MKATMRETNAPMGGELSGHYYFRDNWFCDSGIIATMRVLAALSKGQGTASEVMGPLRRYHSTGEINFEVADKDARIEEVSRAFGDGRQHRLDGITVEYEDWWFNVRKSNTEPLLRLVLEGTTPEAMEAGKKRVMEHLGEPGGE